MLTRSLARQAVALGAVGCRLDPPLYRHGVPHHRAAHAGLIAGTRAGLNATDEMDGAEQSRAGLGRPAPSLLPFVLKGSEIGHHAR